MANMDMYTWDNIVENNLLGLDMVLTFHGITITYFLSGPHCIKLTIDGNFAISGNYHGILDFDWLLSPVTMVVAIDSYHQQ